MALINHSGNYIFRVTNPATKEFHGFSIGMLVNAEAYDYLKTIHSFDLKESTMIHGNSDDFWMVSNLIKDHLSNKKE